MRIPNLSIPVNRNSLIKIFDSVMPSDPCGPCIANCLKDYGNRPPYYAACCELCGNISKVCWYSCCSTGPGCTVTA